MHRNLALVFLLAAFWPASALSAVSPDQVDTIVGDAWGSQSAPPDQSRVNAVLDRQADAATKALGKNDPAWNDKNPKWALVYAKVRADIAADNKPSIDAAPQMARDAKNTIAQNLDPADVKSITDFLKTDEGKRYQDFTRQADTMISEGILVLNSRDFSKLSQVHPSKEQTNNYMRLFLQSRSIQLQTAIAQTLGPSSGAGDIIAMYITLAERMHPDDVEKLYQKYGPDIDKFDAFNRSEAQQHLFHAITLSMQEVHKKMQEIMTAQMPAIKKHQEEWAALYQQQMATAK